MYHQCWSSLWFHKKKKSNLILISMKLSQLIPLLRSSHVGEERQEFGFYSVSTQTWKKHFQAFSLCAWSWVLPGGVRIQPLLCKAVQVWKNLWRWQNNKQWNRLLVSVRVISYLVRGEKAWEGSAFLLINFSTATLHHGFQMAKPFIREFWVVFPTDCWSNCLPALATGEAA